MLKIAYLCLWGLNTVMVLGLPIILRFYDLPQETLHLAAVLFLIHTAGTFFIWPLSMALPNALRAANDVKFTMYVAIISMWLFRCVLAYILGAKMGYGAIGVWIAMVLDWVCRSIFFVWRLKSNKWQKIKLV